MPNEMNDWGRRLDAGETDDAELKLAARLRAARPPVLSMPSATEAAIRARVLNSTTSNAKPRFGFNWPRLNLSWAAGTALSGVMLVLAVAMFSVLSQPQPTTTPTEAIVITTASADKPTPMPAIACDGTAGEVRAIVTSATFDPNVPLPKSPLDLSLLVDTNFNPEVAARATLYVGFASPERAVAWNTSNASLAPDGVEGLTRLEIEAGRRTTVVPMQKINPEALYNVDQAGRVAVFLAVVCNADTVSPTVLFSTVQRDYTFTLPVAGLPSGTLAGSYIVVAGDTCEGIATQFGVALEDLLIANRPQLNEDCSNLQVGQTLVIPLAFSGAGDQVQIVAAKPAGGWLAGEIEVTVAYTLTSAPAATLQIAFVNPQWDGDFSPVVNPEPWEGGLETEVNALGSNQTNATVTMRVPAASPEALQRLAENGRVALYAALTRVDERNISSRLAYDIERNALYDFPTNLICNATRGLDGAFFKSVSIAPNSQLPNAPTAFEVEVEYELQSAPIASLTVGWADPTWVIEPASFSREQILRHVSNSTSMMVTAEQNTVRLRGLIFDPDFSPSVARDGKLALWVGLACGPTGERATWLYSHVWPDHTYFVPLSSTANAVSIASASLTPGATLPSTLTPINVTVNYTLTTTTTATLQIGLANAEWPGSEVDANAGTIFAVGAQRVVITADKNSVTVPFYYEPSAAAQMFTSGGPVNLFATVSYQVGTGEWVRLAYHLAPEFTYVLPLTP